MTSSITTKTSTDDVQVFLQSDLTPQEWDERSADELAIELAGKDRLEKALIIGERLSNIYNSGTFRRQTIGGNVWSWADWVEQRLPEILPEAGKSLDWANERRWLFEVRSSLTMGDPRVNLPAAAAVAKGLVGLIPRRFKSSGTWNPAELKQPAKGMAKVWQLAQRNAAQQQRKNGPTTADVRAAREELRPALLEQGLIREAPKAFQQSTAERMAAASSRTVDMTIDTDRRDRLRAEIVAKKVQEELDRPAREEREQLEDEVRKYNSALISAYSSLDNLHAQLRSISSRHGTQHLDTMRSIDVMGLVTVANDLERIKEMGELLMKILAIANSSNPPQVLDPTTINL